MKRSPGDVVRRYADGTEIRYLPSMGSSSRYRVNCPHGPGYNARTRAEAEQTVRDLRGGDCALCAATRR